MEQGVILDSLPDIDTLSLWLTQYGSFVLFFLLAVGIIALPVPEETLMILAGVFMHQGKLPILPTIVASLLGSLCGITVSYFLGKTAGCFLVKKYGSWVGLTADRWQKAHIWFEKFGKWSLFIGYFIPGVRHFTGLFAGVSLLSYRQFAFYAYTGAFFWVIGFLSIGYFLGRHWLFLYGQVEAYADRILPVLGLILLCLAFIFFHKRRRRRRHSR